MVQMLSFACRGSTAGALVALSLLAVANFAQAQYKVVGPDGKVTYTDREPTSNEGRVMSKGGRATAAAAEPELPFELRQVVAKYPVTLYTATGACEPCTAGRQLLKQRGIPFSERQVVSAEDADALEKLSGGREAPILTIGSQTLRGLAGETWNSYLDAAGYPRESRLPSTYQYRPASPVVARQSDTPARTAPQAAAPTVAADRPASPSSGGIRF